MIKLNFSVLVKTLIISLAAGIIFFAGPVKAKTNTNTVKCQLSDQNYVLVKADKDGYDQVNKNYWMRVKLTRSNDSLKTVRLHIGRFFCPESNQPCDKNGNPVEANFAFDKLTAASTDANSFYLYIAKKNGQQQCGSFQIDVWPRAIDSRNCVVTPPSSPDLVAGGCALSPDWKNCGLPQGWKQTCSAPTSTPTPTNTPSPQPTNTPTPTVCNNCKNSNSNTNNTTVNTTVNNNNNVNVNTGTTVSQAKTPAVKSIPKTGAETWVTLASFISGAAGVVIKIINRF